MRLTVAFDPQLVLVGVAKRLDVQERLASSAFHVEHVGEDVLLAHLGVGVKKHPLLVGSLQFQVVEGVLVGFKLEILECKAQTRRMALWSPGLPSVRVNGFL